MDFLRPPPRGGHIFNPYRSEVLRLYRDVFVRTREFTWHDDRGRLWRDVLRDSARKEFLDGKHLVDVETIGQAVLAGRDSMFRAEEQVGRGLSRSPPYQPPSV